MSATRAATAVTLRNVPADAKIEEIAIYVDNSDNGTYDCAQGIGGGVVISPYVPAGQHQIEAARARGLALCAVGEAGLDLTDELADEARDAIYHEIMSKGWNE